MPKKRPLHNNFREYTTQELNDIKLNVCIAHKCPYLTKAPSDWKRKGKKASNLSHVSISRMLCDYICQTGHPRECMPDLCKHWKDEITKRKTFTESNTYLFSDIPVNMDETYH